MAFKFESGRERVLRRSTIMIRRPPTRAVRLSDCPTVRQSGLSRVCRWQCPAGPPGPGQPAGPGPGLPARASRALVLSDRAR